MTRVLFPTVANICRCCEMQDQGSGSVSQSVSSAAAAMSISYPVNFIKNANCRAESARILQTAPRGVSSRVQTREHSAATSSKQGGKYKPGCNPVVSCSLHVCGGCGEWNRFAEIVGFNVPSAGATMLHLSRINLFQVKTPQIQHNKSQQRVQNCT